MHFRSRHSNAILTPKDARDIYCSLMLAIRERFDTIQALHALSTSFSQAEASAFNGRKIVEGITYGCLVAIENGLKYIPRDIKGQWNAEVILKNLKSKNLTLMPCPSRLRPASKQEEQEGNVKVTIEGIPERLLTHEDLIAIYRRLHGWLHEVNPYVHNDHKSFHDEKSEALWDDLERLRLFVESHLISIQGEAFYCTLWDSYDGHTKVVSLAKKHGLTSPSSGQATSRFQLSCSKLLACHSRAALARAGDARRLPTWLQCEHVLRVWSWFDRSWSKSATREGYASPSRCLRLRGWLTKSRSRQLQGF